MAVQRRPMIGITGRRWPASRVADFIPSALHSASFDLHFSEYPTAVALAGGLPVELTRDAPVLDMVARLDGLMVSGGADVDPMFYSAEPHPELGHVEPERDEWELAMIGAAIESGVPLLGICRGAQLIQVHLGGALVQHVGLDDGDGHPRFDEPRHLPCHRVMMVEGTLAYELYGPTIEVNSLHHQTLDVAAPGLIASGRAPDGVIEAVELPGHQVFGVQWHPEMMLHADPAIAWLVEQARQRDVNR